MSASPRVTFFSKMNIVERLNTEKFLQQRGHEISEDERKLHANGNFQRRTLGLIGIGFACQVRGYHPGADFRPPTQRGPARKPSVSTLQPLQQAAA